MEKISKISKTVDKVLKVSYWVMAVVVVLSCLILGIGCFVFSNEYVMQEKWTIGVGNMNLELAEHVVDNVQILRTQGLVLIATLVLGVFFFCYTIKVLRKILAPMIQEKPFVGTVSGNLKKLGWLIICSSVVMDIVENVGNAIIYAAYDIQNLLLSENIVGVELDFYMIDIKTILLGVLVLLLSHVFSYGEKLQQQDDETL